jgi:hypothetical protein
MRLMPSVYGCCSSIACPKVIDYNNASSVLNGKYEKLQQQKQQPHGLAAS